ncbi:substrate-binding domain-containing protein [Limibaculum sp. M0105]|uniref:Substrate-binding domain-containing protein n=1 Tax=Thermohalobaculum xanthum TaxID=2753746 RepID=A0A8J7MAL5_9RHOB|nr:substrate-binding domain-containing protein [Thermohalobaculum xanthum]MBK0400860.1 substrate-binding domain-containing protein [Thermohalobaculum xanthum]
MPAWATERRRGRVTGGLVALALLAVALAAGGARAQTADLVSATQLRVCSDPANLPFSNKEGEGFENRIADLLGRELSLPVTYTWFPQATGFIRRTLYDGHCDVVIGYAQGDEMVLNTNHYYTSAYVLLTRPDSDLADVTTLADARLQGRRIGVIAGTPPTSHMSRLGLLGHARPYDLMVDRRFDSPNEAMIAALRAGEIDAAVAWGPIAGYLADRAEPALVVTPLLHEEGAPRLFYRITMGVRPGELVWKRKLNSLIRRNQAEIDAILAEYGVPLVDDMGKAVKQ